MHLSVNTYIPGNSLAHSCDARIKLALLLAYSVTVFLVSSWLGLGVLAFAVIALLINAKLPLGQIGLLVAPLGFILGVVWVVNSFTLNVHEPATFTGFAGVSAGFAEGMAPVALLGSFGFVPEGSVRGLFYVCRILLILLASFVVTFTTTSNELADAAVSYMRPLRRFGVPVDDIAMMISIALRFIPLMAQEFMQVRNAQQSRGASFSEGNLWNKITSWHIVLVPLVVGMFRRADALSVAMDSRCYGAGERSSLNESKLNAVQVTIFLLLMALCVLLAVVF